MKQQDEDTKTVERIRSLRPRVDTFETDDALKLVIELPGVAKGDVEVTVEGDLLLVRGERKATTGEDSTLGLCEFGPGRYERAFRLSEELDPEGIDATLEHGLLRLSLRRRHPRHRTIEIRGK